MGRSEWGMIHGAVRWKTCIWATFGAIVGTNWIADAPVPMTATRLPSRSWSWSQRAEWKVWPWKASMPSMSGVRGSLSAPAAEISTRALTSPWSVSTVQRRASSSHWAPVTVVPSRTWALTPKSSATRRR